MPSYELRGEKFDVPDRPNVGTILTIGGVAPDASRFAHLEDEQAQLTMVNLDFCVRFLSALFKKPVEWFYPLQPDEPRKVYSAIMKAWGDNARPFEEQKPSGDTGGQSTISQKPTDGV